MLNNCRIGIGYDEKTRDFSIKSPVSGSHRIPFCPWCGTKFPKDLIDEWHQILEEEYGIDSPDNTEQSKRIPAEFQTDEWWKKRGL